MMEQTRAVPFAPPSPMAPQIPLLTNLSSRIFFAPSAITAAASSRDRPLSACQVAPAAAATSDPVKSAPSTACGCKDKSTIQGVAPARARASAMKRASLPLVLSVANTATAGFNALKKSSFPRVRFSLLGGDFKESVRIHDGIVAATCIKSLVHVYQLRDPTFRDRIFDRRAGLFVADSNLRHRARRGFFRSDLKRALADTGEGCDGNAVRDAGTWSLVAVEIDDRHLPRLGMQALQGIKANPYANGDECAKSAVNARAQLDPFLRRFGLDGRYKKAGCRHAYESDYSDVGH